jgi:hypothetical protein
LRSQQAELTGELPAALLASMALPGDRLQWFGAHLDLSLVDQITAHIAGWCDCQRQ